MRCGGLPCWTDARKREREWQAPIGPGSRQERALSIPHARSVLPDPVEFEDAERRLYRSHRRDTGRSATLKRAASAFGVSTDTRTTTLTASGSRDRGSVLSVSARTRSADVSD